MKIVVCAKHVPASTLRLSRVRWYLDRTGPATNATDRNAMRGAPPEKGGAEVVVVSMGPESATESLRTALGMGADRAVLVSDPAIAGSDLVHEPCSPPRRARIG
jgi:electron transfer flavoprotein beta subunit